MRYREILEACWTGYRQAGMKKKGNRMVPNCVPESTDLEEDGVVAAAPTNVVGRGAIAGTGGLGGEPGVNLKKKKTPVLMSIRRKPIKA